RAHRPRARRPGFGADGHRPLPGRLLEWARIRLVRRRLPDRRLPRRPAPRRRRAVDRREPGGPGVALRAVLRPALPPPRGGPRPGPAGPRPGAPPRHRRRPARVPALPAPRPGRPRVPTTIAWGRRDLLLFPHQARRARRALPGARFVALPGCGHAPMA